MINFKKSIHALGLVTCLVFTVSMIMGCQNKDAPPSLESISPPPSVSVDSTDPTLMIAQRYEALRDAFAQDHLDQIKALTDAMLRSLSTQLADSNGGDGLTALQGALTSLLVTSKKSKPTADALRIGFGEVSQALISMASKTPSLREGRHVFKCPMAQKYSKWVQTSKEMANPYMGKKMLKCGYETDWKP
jgi:hypothetical protein